MKNRCAFLLAILLLFSSITFTACKEKTVYDIVKDLDSELAKSFSKDSYEVGYNEEHNAVVTRYWDNSVTESVETLLAGDSSMAEAWQLLTDESIALNLRIKNMLSEEGFSDVDVYFYITTYDKSAQYLGVKNDEVTFNVADNAKEWLATYVFSSGNYTCGKHFGPGTYNITATSGFGNVSTNDFSLNTILSNDPIFLIMKKNTKMFILALALC